MGKLLLLIISMFTGISLNELNLNTYYTKDKTRECGQIPSDAFIQNDYVNSYSNDGYLWIETEAEPSDEPQVLCFNLEPFYKGQLYLLQKDGTWLPFGSTGTGVLSREKALASWLPGFSLENIPDTVDRKNPLKIRIRIEAYHSSLIQLYSASRFDYFLLSSKLSQTIFTVIAVILTVFILIIICSFNFKDYDAVFMAIMCILLSFDIILTTGISNFTLQTNLTINKAFFKMRYFYLCGSFLCMTATLVRIYKPVLQYHESWVHMTTNIFPIISIFIGAIGIFYLCVNVDDFSGFIFMTVGTLASAIMALSSILFAGRKNPAAYKWIHYIWILSMGLIFAELIFRQIRFVHGISTSARLFDNDFAFSDILSVTLIAFTTLYRMFSRIRTKFAKNQIVAETSREQIKDETKRSYIYSQLSSMLANPMQIFKDKVEEASAFIPHEDYLNLSESMNYSEEIIRTLYMLSTYEKNISSFSQEMEEIDLHALIHDANAADIENLKNLGCYPDYQEKFNNGTCVRGNRLLLSVLLRFILRSTLNIIVPQSTVLIISEYTNYTFTYSVKFESEPVSTFDKKAILDLENFGDSQTSFQTQQSEEKIRLWGIYLHVAKRIAGLFNGQVQIMPEVSSNTISVHMALEPLPYSNSLDFSKMDEPDSEAMDFSYVANSDAAAPNIYILEENSTVRATLVKRFREKFHVYSFATSYDFKEKIDTSKPGAILCSITIPGKNAFELLSEFSNLSVIPFFATAKAASRKTIQQLYKLGAIDVFLKPFNTDTVYFKILSFLSSRQRYTDHIITTFGKTFEQSIRRSQFISRNESHETAPEILAEAAPQKIPSEKENDPVKKMNHSAMLAVFTSANLTSKECSIAQLIAEGKSDKEIASILGISPGTVAVHNKNIYKKLEVHSRAQLIEKVQ